MVFKYDPNAGVPASGLRAALNGDANQRAATELLINAVGGIWLVKLRRGGYFQTFDDIRAPGGWWIDWGQLREDLAADEKALDEFSEWAKSSAGRTATEYELDLAREQLVPYRPWHEASTSEMTVLRIATELAPGGLIGDGLAYLDEANTSTVLIAVAEVAEGRYIKPDWADDI